MLMLWGPKLITFYNDALLQSLGGHTAQTAGFGQAAVENTELWAAIGPATSSVLAGNEPITLQNQKLPLTGVSADDQVRFDCNFSPLTDDDFTISGVLITCSHAAESTVTTAQMRFSQQRFQNLVREAPMGIILLSGPERHVEIVNDAYARLVDRQVSELQGKKLFDVIPEAQKPFEELIDQVYRTQQPLYLNTQPYFVHVDGGKKEGFLDLVYQPYKELDGQITGVIVLCQDVTQQVLARQELEKSEARLRSLVESAPFPIGVYVGEEMRIQLVNQSIIDVWGKGPDVVGKKYAQVLPELAGTGIYEQLNLVLRTGKAYHAENQRVDLMIDGNLKPFYFKYSFTPLFDSAGNVYGVMNTAADVTDLVISQQHLQQAEASLRGAIELAELGDWQLDLETGQVTYSQTIQNWFGFEQDQLPLDQVYNPIHPLDRGRVEQAILQALDPSSEGIYDAEYRIVAQISDRERIVHARGKVLYNSQGQAFKLVGTAQDVTEERKRHQTLENLVVLRTEELAAANEELASANEELAAQNEEYMVVNEELEEANQLLLRSNENLNQFAYVASHDLQEPLRKIQQFGDLLSKQYASQIGTGITYLERMRSSASRMSTLIEDLLNFSSISTQREDNRPLALNSVIENILPDFELVVLETGAQIIVDRLPIIHGNALQLGQLFQNLISNALKFRRPDVRPQIHIQSTKLFARELPASIRPTRNAETYHQIDIIDNGIGFDQQYLERIFQVFQRLHGKDQFSGTGIGLAICAKVMENHGGAITATSQRDNGATFKLYFPS
jgi:PAS domain S-box-containing protein